MDRPTVAVVGGGITGLSAAWALAKPIDAPRIVVFDADRAFGGKLRTTPFAGLPAVDEGADAFLARVPEAVALCRELGLGDELVSPATGVAYVWWSGEMHAIPQGLVLGVPADLAGLARSRLLSVTGKARAALEPLVPSFGDRTAGDNVGRLIRRRFGDEVLERLVDPLVGGINAGDADRLSLRASAPQVADVAARSRSLLVGLRRAASSSRVDRTAPVFHAVRGGMGSIVERLTGALEALGVELRVDDPIATIERVPVDAIDESGNAADHARARYRVGSIVADAVIVATPAHAAAGQLAAVAPTAARLVGTIEHASVAVVTLAFADRQVGRTLDGSGHLVPKPHQRGLTACSWASSKWAHWRVPGQVVLRASLGRFGDDAIAAAPADAIVRRALDELRTPLELSGAPTAVRVSRWPLGFPQHQPGHLALVDRIDERLGREAPGIVVAGAAYRGIGIPACIRQGTAAADRVRRIVLGS